MNWRPASWGNTAKRTRFLSLPSVHIGSVSRWDVNTTAGRVAALISVGKYVGWKEWRVTLELSWAMTAGKRQVERKVMLFFSSFEMVDNSSWVICVEEKNFCFCLKSWPHHFFYGKAPFCGLIPQFTILVGERDLSCTRGMSDRSLRWMMLNENWVGHLEYRGKWSGEEREGAGG